MNNNNFNNDLSSREDNVNNGNIDDNSQLNQINNQNNNDNISFNNNMSPNVIGANSQLNQTDNQSNNKNIISNNNINTSMDNYNVIQHTDLNKNTKFNGKSSKKIIIIFSIIIAVSLIVIGILIFLNNKYSVSENNVENNKKQINKEEKNLIVDGIEYIDSSRNMKDIDARNFTFFIDKSHKKNITFKYKEDKDKYEDTIALLQVLNDGNSIGAIFTYDVVIEDTIGHEKLEMLVSDENYETSDGKKLVTENKKKLWQENGTTCYMDKFGEYYSYQFVVNIDGVKISIYCTHKNDISKFLKSKIKELVKHLSVDDNVGFYIDHFLNNYYGSGYSGTVVSLKSYKYIQSIDKDFVAQIKINDFLVKYVQNDYESDEDYENDKLTYYGDIGDKHIAYYISDYDADGIIVYIYDSKIAEDGEKIYNTSREMFMCPHFQNYNKQPNEFLTELVDSLVKYNKD